MNSPSKNLLNKTLHPNTMALEGIEHYRKAGKITAEAREYGRSLIKTGKPLLEASEKIEEKIFSLGGKPAFPAQISLNEVAAHYCSTPDDKTIFRENDLVKLDIGVHVEGYVADTAVSIDLSKDKRHEKLIRAAEEALQNAIKAV